MTDTTTTRTTHRPDQGDLAHVSPVTPAEDARSVMINNVSWGAIFAGAVIALAVQIILNMVGIGIGAATLDPGAGDNPTAGAFGIGAGLWFAVSAIIAALAGGVAAGRLSGKPKESTAAWHGLTAWAVSTMFVIYLIGSSAGSLLGGAFTMAGNVVGGVAGAAGSAVEAVVPADPFAAIERNIRSAAPADADPAAARDAAIAAVRRAVTGTDAQAAQQAAQALAQAQGIPVQQAERQIAEYQAQFTQTVEKAKETAVEAADTAAAATATGALLAALMLVLGALAGWFGGRMGVVEPTLTAGRRIG